MKLFHQTPARFRDRDEAGVLLGEALAASNLSDPVVLALPRGGVPIGAKVAEALEAPLDVLVVRKLGVPWQPEFAFGAVGEGGVAVIDRDLVMRLGLSEAEIDRVATDEATEVNRRLQLYRGGTAMAHLEGRTVIIVDDGMATGSTVLAAIAVLRQRRVGRIVVAVPVASSQGAQAIREQADDVVVLNELDDFRAVGLYYEDFRQLQDEEVTTVLQSTPGFIEVFTDTTDAQSGDPWNVAPAHVESADVGIPVDQLWLAGILSVPATATGIVVFVHGSGSSRLSSRNQAVANYLNSRGFATLLFDLLTPQEAADPSRAPVFDITMLADRLVEVTAWLRNGGADARMGGTSAPLAELPIGYFGASTGGGAALVASVRSPFPISAVVSRGGRPDLASEVLPHVGAPTLLLVGGRDHEVYELNRLAAQRLRCHHQMGVIPGATHLFEEPGTLEQVARKAGDWFTRWLDHEDDDELGI
jgi:putative phosphoribosyl transferase